MAYVAFDAVGAAAHPAPPAMPRPDPVATAPARFSALEWSVVALARNHRLSSLREPGRLSLAIRTLFGNGTTPRLADGRLEALRRIAVLAWHHSYRISTRELKAFLAAGFTPDQFEVMMESISVARARQEHRPYAG